MTRTGKMICSVMAIIGLITGGSFQYRDEVIDGSLQPDAASVGMVQVGDLIAGELIVSPNALKVIGNAEGCIRNPYVCPAGLLTDGIGNTHGVTGEAKSDEQIALDWVKNIMSAQQCLAASGDVSKMTQGQIDAFTSFIFNTGCGVFQHNKDGSETRIYHKIKQGWFTSACNELNYWVYAGGKKLSGLVTRRETETMVCHF